MKTTIAIALVSLMMAAIAAAAQTNYFREQVQLAWTASASVNTVVGYRVYYGASSRGYTNSSTIGNVTNITVTLDPNQQGIYYFAVTARDAAGLESDFSNEVAYMLTATNAPPAPGDLSILKVTLQRSPDLVTWTTVTNFNAIYVGTTNGTKFYRSVLSISP